jgi:type IV pilus assembly protein PilY1
MKFIISNKARITLGSAIASALLLSASVSFADDTEVFFGGPSIDTGVRPNVLFILDNSGSMQWRLASNNNPLAGEQSRLQVLKDSFAQIMSNAGKINAGVMVLTARPEYNDSLLMYPVTNIDDVLPSSAQQVASTPRINGSADDASQSTLGGGAVINGTSLQMGYVSNTSITANSQSSVLVRDSAFFQSKFTPTAGPFAGLLSNFACAMNENGSAHNAGGDACGNDDKDNINIRSNTDTNAGNPGGGQTGTPIIGTAMLHFTGLNVPPTAGLDASFRAYLDLVPTNTQTGGNRPTVVLDIQNAKVPALPQSLTEVDTGRTYLASLSTPNTPWVTGIKSRIEITNQVKDILDNDGASLTGLFLKMRATTSRDYTLCLASGNGAIGSQCGTLAGGLFKAPTLVVEYNSTATTIETKSAALRFQDVGIPQGATIQTARIDFHPAAGNNDGDTLTLNVQARLANNAAAFTPGENLLSGARTTATSWVVPEWVPEMPVVPVEGPSVASQVQAVVNQGGWCGNNSMAFTLEPTDGNSIRTAFSYDGGIGLQPTLTVTYTGGETGCLNPILEATVSAAKDDAYQRADGQVVLDGTNIPLTTDRFAARFTGIPLNQGATILDAQLILTPNNTVASPNVSSLLRFEQTNNASALAANNNNISDRTEAGDSTCTINNWTIGTPFVCSQSGLRTGLQGIINRAGWTAGNALVITGTQSTTNTLQAKSFENNPGQAIKLRMKVAHGGLSTTGYTVRQHINALVQSMVAPHSTPIVPAYLEAAKYLRGESSSLGSSPITSACQPTHVVLLTDGQSNSNTTDTKSAIAALTGSCSSAIVTTGDDPGIADTGSTADGERCGRKLSEWLLRTDQSTLAGDSFINTHTIGFAFGAQSTNAAELFMRDIADNGGGGAYTADNASELTAAFSDILQTVQSVDTTFVSASAPVNSFERADNQDQLYFSLFRPKATNTWPGNLKRYRFAFFDNDGNLNPQIVDQDNVAAIDFNTGGFKTDARSFWSESDDGNLTEAGGAAKKLPSAASRSLYTYISDASPSSATALSNLATGNTAITNAVLNAADDTAREAQFNYIRGLTTDLIERKAIGDPIHSSPRLATYSCLTPNLLDPAKCDVPDQTAFIGTNEGLLQAFNTQTGVELFGFMPQELLGNIKKRMLDAQSTSLAPRPYGLDNPVTLWVNDLNNDGKVLSGSTPQAGEFIYAYASMGRGGRNIYAMDVTDRSSPKILWYIKGGVTPGFAKLGQTWSAPIKSKIDIGGTITDVLVFAGGYDELQDDASNPLVTNRTGDNMGNAIYVVNAKTGSLIWSASNEASNSSASQGHLQLAGMKYSIPANVRLIDLQMTHGNLVADENKLADQLFVGDTGGQVWRLYINNGETGTGLITAGGTGGNGIFASAIPPDFDSLDAANKLQNQRRFYNTPEVALMKKNGQLSLSVNIGSGYRGHPLKTETLDRFYSFRTNNLVSPNGTEGTLREAHLLNLTANESPTTDSAIATINGTQEKGGWFIPLTNSGEKVLTRALTTGTQQTIYFNTYQPSANTSSCTATFGTSRAYAVSLYDATAVDPITNDPVPRFNLLSSPGIPPQPEELCIGNNCAVIKGPGTGTGNPGIDIIDTPPPGLMYWIDDTGA